MRTKYMTKHIVTAMVIAAAVIAIHVVPATVFAGNFTVPAQEIKPVNGAFVFNAAAFNDGVARHFAYTYSPNQR